MTAIPAARQSDAALLQDLLDDSSQDLDLGSPPTPVQAVPHHDIPRRIEQLEGRVAGQSAKLNKHAGLLVRHDAKLEEHAQFQTEVRAAFADSAEADKQILEKVSLVAAGVQRVDEQIGRAPNDATGDKGSGMQLVLANVVHDRAAESANKSTTLKTAVTIATWSFKIGAAIVTIGAAMWKFGELVLTHWK